MEVDKSAAQRFPQEKIWRDLEEVRRQVSCKRFSPLEYKVVVLQITNQHLYKPVMVSEKRFKWGSFDSDMRAILPQAATIEARNFSEGSIKEANGKREIQGWFVDAVWTDDSLKGMGTFTPILGV